MLLVQRVSSVNATLGETTGADVSDVRLAVGGDGHVRVAFLNAGVGFGRPSMQKDVLLLEYWRQVPVEILHHLVPCLILDFPLQVTTRHRRLVASSSPLLYLAGVSWLGRVSIYLDYLTSTFFLAVDNYFLVRRRVNDLAPKIHTVMSLRF
jgi:hypothetical protein